MSERDVALVQELQQALENVRTAHAYVRPLLKIAREELWRCYKDAKGAPFSDFGAFAVHVRPQGLEVRDKDIAHMMRNLLCANDCTGAWVDLLERIVRHRGAPPRNPAIGEIKRFYSLPASATSRDRLLLRLKQERADLYDRILYERLSPYRAALEAGFVKRDTRCLSVEELHASIDGMPPQLLVVLIREAWERLRKAEIEVLRQELLVRTPN